MTSSQGEEVILYETHQEGLEPSTYRLEGDCSIQLSYWCTGGIISQQIIPVFRRKGIIHKE